MIHGLDLFSGIGGLSLALAPWVRPIAYCENERYAQCVLLSRMASGELPVAPIWDDVRTLDVGKLGSASNIDIIYGGFPCQDISVAGIGKGLEGKRSGLFFEVVRLIAEIKPSFVFLENVPAIRTRGAERVGKELSSRGYDCRWNVISASEVGAPHLRKRWFLLATDTKRLKLWDKQRRGSGEGWKDSSEPALSGQKRWRDTRPEFCRMDDGFSFRMERIRALGNAVVPIQAQTAFKNLMGLG